MLKKIPIGKVILGMVVEKMDRSWMEHPFLTNKKKITAQKHIDVLREYGITEVYIDTDEGLDVAEEDPLPVAETPAPEPPPTPTVVVVAPPPPRPVLENLAEPLAEPVPLKEEVKVARVIQQEAQTVVQDVMHDVRIGKNIESGKVNRVVSHMVDSIFRNRDALSSLTRLKGYDAYTFVHSINVCVLCLTLGRQIGFTREEMEVLGTGALLHDAGKILIPNHILNKPGRLTEDEFVIMKKHAELSVEVLEEAEGIPLEAKQVAHEHHERFNGKGYPRGLAGNEISRFGQVAAIVDVYDAMTSDRVYQKGIPAHEGVKKIYDLGAAHFNPAYLDSFIRCMGIYPIGTLVELDTGELAIVITTNKDKLLRPEVIVVARNAQQRLLSPLKADLTEKAADGKRFRRTIAKPLDPSKYGIAVSDFVDKATGLTTS